MPKMYHDLILALKEAASDEKTFITVITGRGDYYSSGNDITSGADFVSGDLKERINEACILIRNFVNAFIEFPKILVAAVNGPAIGIGVTTLGLCDVVYASDKATFHTPFVPLGISAEGCSTYTFPRIMGTSKAGDLLYFNYKMTAKEAKDCGLVSEVFPDSCFAEKVFGHLKKMVTMPSKSMIFTKALVRRWDVDELRKANEAECERLKERWGSEDFINAVVKFISRRNKL
ncbi:enoyl-CoA delta isomerase 2-like isoform X2 [Hetaerina americana]|uniref:enoyl-CoA delta isomerase 2-like isoform X2 n=1 Tax=Hetaerina americana TaxID=62018 RepID=UPI003A7F285C